MIPCAIVAVRRWRGELMAIENLSISFGAEVAEEVKHYAPDCGLWRLVNAAVRQYWRAIRLREAAVPAE